MKTHENQSMTRSLPNGCVIARKPRQDGYGKLRVGRKTVYLHRRAYEIWFGPIPKGMQIDHLCRNRACCNPNHLEVVWPSTNIRRGIGWGGQLRKPATHCKRGHPWITGNLYFRKDRPGRAECAICRSLPRKSS